MSALEGLRVLDLSRAVPGPYCTMLFADLGADVLMIEPPHDVAARARTTSASDPERDAAFTMLRRNKRSICLDLKQEEGRTIFHSLARGADVVLEGFRPGVAARLGADYPTLRALNPRLVYCSLSGYGQTGPYRDLPGHDINYVALGGALGMIGRPGVPPAVPLQLVGDVAGGGLMAAFAILSALFARGRTGTGQSIDLAISDGVLSLLSRVAGQYFESGVVPRPGEYRLTGALPFYDVYACADGKYLSVGPLEPHFLRGLCEAIGHPELSGIGEGATAGELSKMRSVLAETFRTKPRDEWFRILSAVTCVAPVLTLDEVFADTHHLHREMLVHLDHPRLGKIPQVGIAPKLSETPGTVRTAGVMPGASTAEVLRGLGYAEDAIDRLRASRVVA